MGGIITGMTGDQTILRHGPERVPGRSWYGGVELTADSDYGPLTDRSDREVAGKTRTGTEGSGMERADPNVHDWG